MTTIAANKTEMACDLQATHSGGVKFKIATKIIDVPTENAMKLFGTKRALIGFCGSVDTWGEVVGWFHIPEGKPPKCRGIEMLMLNENKELWHATNLVNWTELKVNEFAIGSGMQFAIAAMDTGKSPLEACKLASKYDPNTGMGYKVYKL